MASRSWADFVQGGTNVNLNMSVLTPGVTVHLDAPVTANVQISSVAISTMPPMSVNNFPQYQVIGGTVVVQSMLGSSNLPVYFASPQDVFFTNPSLDVTGSTVSVNVSTHMSLDFGANTVGAVLITDSQNNDAQVTGAGRLKVDGSGVTQPVSGTVSVSNFVAPSTHTFVDNQVSASSHVIVDNQVAESTHVSVDNFPSTQAVTGAFFQATQPISGTVSVSGQVQTSTHVIVDNQVTVSTHVAVDNFPVSQAVTGTFFQTTQPISGAVSVSNFPASQAVTGTFFQAIQPVSISSVSVSGSSVTVQNFPAVQQVQASSGTVNAVSLGTAAGKTAVLRTGSLVTTAVTANQVVSTYTVTAGKTFYMEYITASARLTVLSATASILGTFSFQVSGVNVLTETNTNPTIEQVFPMAYYFAEPIPFPGGTGIAVVCTPAATTSMTWTANFGGYER